VFPFHTFITVLWFPTVDPHFITNNSETQESITPPWQCYNYNQLQLYGSKSYLGTHLAQTLWMWSLWWMTSKVELKIISSGSANSLIITLLFLVYHRVDLFMCPPVIDVNKYFISDTCSVIFEHANPLTHTVLQQNTVTIQCADSCWLVCLLVVTRN
jgi:hypothetical protein